MTSLNCSDLGVLGALGGWPSICGRGKLTHHHISPTWMAGPTAVVKFEDWRFERADVV